MIRKIILIFITIILTKGLIAQDISVNSPSKLIADSFFQNKGFLNATMNYEKYLLHKTGASIDHDYILLAHSYYKTGNEEKPYGHYRFL